jgi:hypothetical protein
MSTVIPNSVASLFTDWLSILSVKHNVKFYPPVSMSCFFHDFKLSDAALRSVMLPSVTKSFPRRVILDPEEDGELEGREIPWEELTWDLFFGYCGSMLGHKRTDDPSSAKSGDGFVFKRYSRKAGVNDHFFLYFDDKESVYKAHGLDKRAHYENPRDWLATDAVPELFRVEPYDCLMSLRDYKVEQMSVAYEVPAPDPNKPGKQINVIVSRL